MSTRASVIMFAQNYAPEPSGNAPYVTSLAEGLTASGEFDVRVVTAHPYYPDWRIAPGYGQWSRDEQRSGVAVSRRLHYVPNRPSAVRRLLSELSFGIRSVFTRWGRPDVIVLVSPSLFACALTMIRAKLFAPRTPIVTWVQDLYTLGVAETGSGSNAARLVGSIEGAVLRGGARVVVIHDRFRRSVERLFGLGAEQVEVVRNWTHIEPVAHDHRSAARRHLGWGDDEVVALHTGNMGVKQGLETVVRAAAIADETESNVRFVLLGGGNQRDRLRALGGGISALEFIDSLPDDEYALALVAADVLVVNELPGVSGMAVPSKLTSYFAAGRPVVAATDRDGVTADEIRASQAGICVPAGDARALLGAIAAVGADEVRGRELGDAGIRYYRRLLSQDAAIGSFGAVLLDVLGRR